MISYISNWNIFAMRMRSAILKEKFYFWMLILQDIRLVKDYFGTTCLYMTWNTDTP
jgi:hypothetical protein